MNTPPLYAGGFLYNPIRQEVLLHKRDGNTNFNPNKWAFFGGLANDGESPARAFVRELKEELSIDISENSPVLLCQYLNRELNARRFIFYVPSEIPKSAMTLGEGDDFDWIPLSKVFSYDLTVRSREDLQFFIKYMKP